GSATLIVTTAANTPAGSGTLTITGTSGSLIRTATVALIVNTASVGGAISINFVGNGTSMGVGESAGVVPKANRNNATGATRSTPLPLKDDTGGATPAMVSWSADNTWSTPITDSAGNPRLMKGYLDNGFGHATTVTVGGLPVGAYDVYVYADGDGSGSRTGSYQISGTGSTPTTITLTDPANTNFDGPFTAANTPAGNYVKFSIAAGGFTLTATPVSASDGTPRAPVNGVQIVPTASAPPPAPDFTIAATPGSRTVVQGTSTSYTVTVGALNGFAGTVSLAVSGLPANATASFTPASDPGTGGATLSVTPAANTTSGNATLTITGTSSGIARTTTVLLLVSPPPDFTIAATPASQTIASGGSTSYTVTTSALNGFAGIVSLTVSGLPANATASFTPAFITGSGSATLIVTTAANTPAGSGTLTITGTSGSLIRTATVALIVNTASVGGAISINFVGNGTSMGVGESAGVVPKANWNNATGATRSTPLPLKDDTGGATPAMVSWSADNTWSTPITDTAGNPRLMKG